MRVFRVHNYTVSRVLLEMFDNIPHRIICGLSLVFRDRAGDPFVNMFVILLVICS